MLDFLGIGPPRCGTTSLYERLRAHPEVWVPPIKELHYWNQERSARRQTFGRLGRIRFGARRMVGNRRPGDAAFMARYVLGRRTDRWYASLFADVPAAAAGELTPAYCVVDDEVLDALAAQHPAVKPIVVLRDPIQRAWSNAAKRLAREQGRPLSSVTDDELEAYFDRPVVRAHADYPTILRRWRSRFPEASVFVGFLEDMQQEPDEFFGRLAEHLAVDPAPLLDVHRTSAPANTTEGYRVDIPARWERHLASQYLPSIEAIADELGGPAVGWYERAQAARTA